MTPDKQVLKWFYLRLIYQYKEHPDYDYMRKLRAIIETIPEDQDTNWATTTPKQLYTDDWREIESDKVERFR